MRIYKKKLKLTLSIKTTLVCLYEKVSEGIPLKLISMDLKQHIVLMHKWARQYHSDRYVQSMGDFVRFLEYYKKLVEDNNVEIIIAYWGSTEIAQIEICPLLGGPMARYYRAGVNDICIHLLMAPYKDLDSTNDMEIAGYSIAVLQTVLEYLFYLASVENVFARPDRENIDACLLAERAGFAFIKEITLADHTVQLFKYSRQDFLKKYPKPVEVRRLDLFSDKFKMK